VSEDEEIFGPEPSRAARRRSGIVRPHVLPTLLTLGNLGCGFLAIVKASDAMATRGVLGAGPPESMIHNLEFAGWLIFTGMIFDMLDGRVARLSGGTSALGNVLDSLADVVSFGAAPAFLAKCIAEGVGGMRDNRFTLYFSLFFAAMAALRLARYSSHSEDPEEAHLWFQGLPTPGAAGVIAGLALLLSDRDWRPEATLLRFLPVATLVLGVLMVTKFPYAHVANRFLKGSKPVTYLVLTILAAVISLAWKFEVVLAGAVLAYALSGPVVWLVRRRRSAGARVRADAVGASRRGDA
jgi:CDP-diacylglycerol--serine O-phosphatidyltransferase